MRAVVPYVLIFFAVGMPLIMAYLANTEDKPTPTGGAKHSIKQQE